MPLPAPNQTWPPKQPITRQLGEWQAWLSGDVAALAGLTDPFTGLRALDEHNFNLARSDRFWAKQARREPHSSTPEGVHVPLAAEIASVGGDLVAGQSPKFTIPFADPSNGDDAARTGLTEAEARAVQARLEDILTDSDFNTKIRESAEISSGLSGVYLRATWNRLICQVPFLTSYTPAQALPEWMDGRLYAVTFWRELPDMKAGVTWRHVERHEPRMVNGKVRGVILNGLYVSDDFNDLGHPVDLTAHPQTASLQPEVWLPENYPYPLSVEWVPNVRPNRLHPGSPYGRADIEGSEGLLERLDLVVSSLIRDIELGKGRLSVPSAAFQATEQHLVMETGGRGAGKHFDLDRAIYDPVNIDPSGEGQKITISQFAIRADEHINAAMFLIRQIVSACGYAVQTFGIDVAGRAESGTALRILQARTFSTVDRKRSYLTGPLRRLAAGLLALDAAVFGRPTLVTVPDLSWPDAHTEDPVELAQSLNLLASAKAASIETLVRLAHPNWDDVQVRQEVERIFEDQTRGTMLAGQVPDPALYDASVRSLGLDPTEPGELDEAESEAA